MKWKEPVIINDMFVYMPKRAKGAYEIPSNVKRIVGDAFWCCKHLTSITLPDNLEYIGEYAFSGCSKITTLTIPGTLKKIMHAAFEFCGKLKEIHILVENPKKIKFDSDVFEDFDVSSCTLYVPAESVELYQKHREFKHFKKIIGEA
jgi:hypothetical protein